MCLILDKIETVAGSSSFEFEFEGEDESGEEWRMRPTPSLLADPSRPKANNCFGNG